MSTGTTLVGIGTPPHPGVYAVEVYFGWKLLEWHNGEWWHGERVGRWTASLPLQWVGPMPARRGEAPKPKSLEFDL